MIFSAFRSASCVCLRIPFEKVLPLHIDVALLGHVVDESPVTKRDRRLRVGHGIIFQCARQTLHDCPAPFGGGASSDEGFRNLRTVKKFLRPPSTSRGPTHIQNKMTAHSRRPFVVVAISITWRMVAFIYPSSGSLFASVALNCPRFHVRTRVSKSCIGKKIWSSVKISTPTGLITRHETFFTGGQPARN